MLITVAASSNWICSFAVPRHLARLARLRSVIAPSTVGDPFDRRVDTPRGLAACAGGLGAQAFEQVLVAAG